MKIKKLLASVTAACMICSLSAVQITASASDQYKTSQTLSDLSGVTESLRDVTVSSDGTYAYMVSSDGKLIKSNIIENSYDIVDTEANGVKAVLLDEKQNVLYVSTVSGDVTGDKTTQKILVYGAEDLGYLADITYTTPTNTGKSSDLYSLAAKLIFTRYIRARAGTPPIPISLTMTAW